MAYETTSVQVWKSQSDINRLIMSRGGMGIGFFSEPPREFFQAKIKLDGSEYRIQIEAKCKEPERNRRNSRGYLLTPLTDAQLAEAREQEQRRVWRVLYYYLKNAFECAESGVIELRQVLMAHVVMPDGKTIGDHILPRLAEVVTSDPARLLTAAAAVGGGGGGPSAATTGCSRTRTTLPTCIRSGGVSDDRPLRNRDRTRAGDRTRESGADLSKDA